MLPDFPDQKRQFFELTDRDFLAEIHSDPLLSTIPSEPIFEGASIRTSAESGYEESTDLSEIEHEIVLDLNEVIENGHTVYLKLLGSLAEKMKKDMAELIQSGINSTTERTGNCIDLGGAELKEEHILEMFRNIEITFDENDQPDFSTAYILVHPDTAPVLERLDKSIKTVPRYRSEFKQIIEQKRREWHARENHRKLVD